MKTKMFPLEFSDYQDADASLKNKDFQVEYASTSAKIRVQVLMEEIELENEK